MAQFPKRALLPVLAALAALVPGWPVATAAAQPFEMRVPVLYYHRVECAPPQTPTPYIFICPRRFERQMAHLASHGWHAITADRLAFLFTSKRCPKPRRFVVSFDDGWIDGHTTAAPILARYGMRGTFYVNPGSIGTSNRMSLEQLQALQRSGHAIGNHGLTHADLDVADAATLELEIEGAQQLLAGQIGYRPLTFAWPMGRYSPAALEQARRSGLTLAFRTGNGASLTEANALYADRIPVGPHDSPERVLAKVRPFAQAC